MTAEKILVTGALGQIGTELVRELRARCGAGAVVASDVRRDVKPELIGDGPYVPLDVLDIEQLDRVVKEHGVKRIYHLAAILSATGEKDPTNAWNVNVNGLFHVLEVARHEGCSVFVPSSIA